MLFSNYPISVCRRALLGALAFASFFLAAPAAVSAQAVTVSWDPSTDANVTGYLVHSGTQPGAYSSLVDVGNRTTAQISGVDPTRAYYFAVQAYTADGLVSQFSQEVTLPALPQATTTIGSFVASTAVPLLAGTNVTWTAAATSTAGPVQYKFLLFRERAGWTVAQDYSSAASFSWTPGLGDAGKAAVQVWVRSVGSTQDYEAWKTTGLFDVNTVPVKLTADTGFPVPPGQAVTWTATIAAATTALQYKFLMLDTSTSVWSIVRDYAAGNTVTWTAPHNGRYAFQVWVRSSGSTATYDIWAGSGEFVVGPSPLSVVSLDADRSLPQSIGTTITWTARTAGGTSAPLQYKFLRYSAQSGWTVVQDYSTSRTYRWSPTWGDEGSHYLQVWVRNAGSSATYDAWLGTAKFEVTPASLQLTTATLFPSSPAATVVWKAEVPDATLSLEYAFYVCDMATGTWRLAQAYGASNTFTWTPGTAGTYVLQAWARRTGSSVPYDIWRGTDLLTIGNARAQVKAFTSSTTFPAAVGTPITWSAAASGGHTTGLEYRFLLLNTATGWSVLRDYATSRSVVWTPTVAGTYAVQVWVRSVGSAETYEDWQGTSYFVIR